MVVAVKLYREPAWSVPGYYIDILRKGQGYRAVRESRHVDSKEEALRLAKGFGIWELQDMTLTSKGERK